MAIRTPADDGRGFSLTDLQSAYLVGELGYPGLRTPAYVAHGYQVEELNAGRLERAIAALVQRHEALRLVVTGDGQNQRVAPAPERGLLNVDWTALDEGEARRRFDDELRGAGGLLAPLDAGPAVTCAVYRTRRTWFVLLALRLFALDARSFGLVYRDLARLYAAGADPSSVYRASPGVFAGFVARLEALKTSPARQESVAYWDARRASLPPAPQLPVRTDARSLGAAAFRRRHHRLSAPAWARLQDLARKHALSASAVLCTAYAEVLRRWSSSKAFSLTVLASQRALLAGDPQIEACVGNFGTTFLLATDGHARAFADKAQRILDQTVSDLPHAAISAIEVLRRGRGRPSDGGTLENVPYVFASGLAVNGRERLPEQILLPGWTLVDKVMQTPQVLLDHQVSEDRGELVCNFDHVAEAFEEGVIEELVDYHASLLDALARDESAWQAPRPPRLPAAQLGARRQANRTGRPVETTHVFQRFEEAAASEPDRVAFWSDEEIVTRGAARARVARLAASLRGRGAAPVVGVLARKSVAQNLAALAVVESGSAYLPLNVDWPARRIGEILRASDVSRIVADAAGARLLADPAVAREGLEIIPLGVSGSSAIEGATRLRQPRPDELAYVIFTSGSTGVPKGVAIPHAGLLNTVVDVAGRFGLGPSDRILSLSELNFDLSAFDLFGALHCGGTMVVPTHERRADPEHWAELLASAQVTVWNTVPALLEMLLDHLGDEAGAALARLRLVLLSGDWIPLGLPARLRRANPRALIVSLGGATEASIWSNYHVVGEIDPTWRSIPYGTPLANQRLHVLDADREDAPTAVAGELFIGGDGVAACYHLNAELTAARFVRHPDTDERLYRTGDLARYRPDGSVELLGRIDDQVKLRGHRLDLVEIEKHLVACDSVRAAACVIDGEPPRQRLIGFYVAEPVAEPGAEPGVSIDPGRLRAALEEQLPRYMIPALFCQVDRIPLTANGKRDAAALRTLASAPAGTAPATSRPPATATERALADLWREVSGSEVTSVDADFFAVGGSSLLAVKLGRSIQERFGRKLPLSALFQHHTIAAQAALVDSPVESAAAPRLARLRDGDGEPFVFVHPVGGHVLAYRAVVAALPEGSACHGLEAPPVARLPGTLAELARHHADCIAAELDPTSVNLVGWSLGGVLALEMARLLEARMQPVRSLTLIDCHAGARGTTGAPAPIWNESDAERGFAMEHAGRADRLPGEVRVDSPDELFDTFRALYGLLVAHPLSGWPTCATELVCATRAVSGGFIHLVPLHRHPSFAPERVRAIRVLDADHYSIMQGAHARAIAGFIAELAAVVPLNGDMQCAN